MLENRSFDHMFGFSKIQGTDAQSGRPTGIDGLAGTEQNSAGGRSFQVTAAARFVVSSDPGHEFVDVREQLCGPDGNYSSPAPSPGSIDPAINNRGFVSSFAGKYPSADPATVMRCFRPEQLPVLTTLAQEFALCDGWFSSMPGPTWPNRFFVHAATAGGLDHSPSLPREIVSMAGDAYSFENGTVYDLLDNNRVGWAIYAGDEFPQALHMKGMAENLPKFRQFWNFRKDLLAPDFTGSYVFIEPDWHPFTHFKGGNSQHPVDDVTRGEALIQEVYEAIRNSPLWEKSLLIITYDEHGGFYDHIRPPTAVDPGDKPTSDDNNRNGFNFKQLGVRVPTVVVSPYLARGVIDHRIYDHSSIPATIEGKFGLGNLTLRDKQAARVTDLLTLKNPRDAPLTLPPPVASGEKLDVEGELGLWFSKMAEGLRLRARKPVDSALAGFVHVALQRKLAMSDSSARGGVVSEAKTVRSEAGALLYLRSVRKMTRAQSVPLQTKRSLPRRL